MSDCFDHYEEAMSDAMFGGRTYDESPVYERYEKNPHKHDLPEDKLCPECSIVDNGWIGSFMYAEVEFDTEEEAKSYKPIDLLGRDVTEESYYKMKRYWERKIK